MYKNDIYFKVYLCSLVIIDWSLLFSGLFDAVGQGHAKVCLCRGSKRNLPPVKSLFYYNLYRCFILVSFLSRKDSTSLGNSCRSRSTCSRLSLESLRDCDSPNHRCNIVRSQVWFRSVARKCVWVFVVLLVLCVTRLFAHDAIGRVENEIRCVIYDLPENLYRNAKKILI